VNAPRAVAMKNERPAGGVDKRDGLQAVVVASSFHGNFWPAAGRDDACLLPLANKPLLYYTLDMLESAGVADAIVFCPSGSADRIKAFVRDAGFRRLDVAYTSSDTCRSLGDVLRHLDACALVRGDFVLLWGNVVGRLPLLSIADAFKELRTRRDKGAVMALVCQRSGGGSGDDGGGGQTLVLDAESGRVLYHNRKRGRIDLPVELVLNRGGAVLVRRDLCDTNVAVCSAAVPPLFADNFDFQTKDDFVKGLLINEEILNSTLYVHEVDDGYANRVTDWPSYQRVSHDVLHRWTYPQVPEIVGRYGLRHGNVYLADDVKLALSSDVGNDTAVGPGTTLAGGARLLRSVVGAGCTVGADVTVEHSYLFDGVVVGDRSVIRYSVLGRDCTVGADCVVADSCIVGGGGVVIEPGTELRRKRVLATDPDGNMTCLGGSAAYAYEAGDDSDSDGDEREVTGLTCRDGSAINSCRSSVSSSNDDDASSIVASIPDDTCMFYSEVVDSLIRGFEDHVHCDNLILEINSSRYAYNINYREANFQVIRAMLTLNSKAELEALNQVRFYTQLPSKLDYFLPVLKNYIKTADSCEDCLSAIEDVAKCEEMLNTVVVKLIHHLYDVNVLNEESILKWHQKEEDTQFAKDIREKANKLIEWLKDAEEETDSDDD